MITVIDASGAVELIFRKEKYNMFKKIIDASSIILSPDFYITELTNTLWKYHKAKIKNKVDCFALIKDGIELVNVYIDSKEIWEEAFSEGIVNNHSVYDMFYMVTARRNSGTLLTNDSTLAAICRKNHVQVCC
jgi:predicted nucleic acid-binding protein